jgi:hypothetical protein
MAAALLQPCRRTRATARGPWLDQLKRHVAQYGFKAFLPRALPAGNSTLPNWRLPFLLPLTDLPGREIDNILVVQLDIGYLAVLFQHIDLGRSGLVRLLQDDGQERLRIDNSGVVVAGQTLVPGLPGSGEVTGQLTQYSLGGAFQSLYRRMPERGFSVMVSQRQDEILAPATHYSPVLVEPEHDPADPRQPGLGLRLLHKRQEAFTGWSTRSRSTSN